MRALAQALADEKETAIHMRVWAVSFANYLASSTTGRVAWFRRVGSIERLKARGQVLTRLQDGVSTIPESISITTSKNQTLTL